MTRKHFEAIANAIAYNAQYASSLEARRLVLYIAQDVAENLAQFNPNFDKDRFLKACKVEE